MESISVSGENHSHQQPNEEIKTTEVCCCCCCCNGVSNSTKVKGVHCSTALHISLKSSIIAEVKSSIAELKSSIAEEVEKALNQVLQSMFQKSVLPSNQSTFPDQAEPSAPRRLQLQIKNLPDTLYTRTKIEKGPPVEVELVDTSGKRVEDGPESCMMIKIDALNGDFDVEVNASCTEEYYDKNIAKQRINKGALLDGKCVITMSRGVANFGQFFFTDNSKSRTGESFRLGAKVVNGCPDGVVVKAAVSDPVRVKERRLKYGRKNKKATPKDVCETCAKTFESTHEIHRCYDHASRDVLISYNCAFNNASVSYKGQEGQPYQSLDKFQKEPHKSWQTASEIHETFAPTNQITDQRLSYPSSVQEQEQSPPSNFIGDFDFDFDEIWQSLSASDHMTEHTHNIHGVTVDEGFSFDYRPHENGEELKASLPNSDPNQVIMQLDSTPPEERGNVSVVSAHEHVTRKLIAACYMTKAAVLFMISVEQDPRAPNKKQKLQ